MPTLSVVIIGRNEGSQLIHCIESARAIPNDEIIYVDSASTDQSVENAKALGVKIIEITSPTAAKARNAGWKVAQGEFILFLDADCELFPDFIQHAWPLFTNPEVAIVDGDIIEKAPTASLYHRVLAWEWNPPAGKKESAGGNAVIRKKTLDEVGGFDPHLSAGEEPEMSRRIRAKGYSILHLSIPMVKHDLQMYTLQAYLKRAMRTGYAYAQISERFWHTSDPLWKKASLHNITKVFSGIIIFIFSLLLSYTYSSWIPTLSVTGLALFWIAFKAYRMKRAEKSWNDSLLYALHCQLVQIPIFIGQLSYWLKRRRAAK